MEREEYIHWQASEYARKERSSDWFWIAGAVIIALSIVSIMMENILLAVIFILGGFSFIAYERREPEMIKIALAGKGVILGNNLYQYKDLQSFAVDDEPPKRRIVLVSSRSMLKHIYIPIGDEPVDNIRECLAQFLPEVHYEPTITDLITEYI